MVYFSLYAAAVLTVSITLTSGALGAADEKIVKEGWSKNVDLESSDAEAKTQKAKEEAAFHKRKKVLLGAGIGSALAVAVIFLGLKVLGTKMIQTKHEETGIRVVEEAVSLTEKLTLASEQAFFFVEFSYPDGFSEAVKALSPEDKLEQVKTAGKELQKLIDSKQEDSHLTATLRLCEQEVTANVHVKFIGNSSLSPKAGEST